MKDNTPDASQTFNRPKVSNASASGPAALPLPPSSGCFVCGTNNQRGLGLRFELLDSKVSTTCTLDRHFSGFHGRTHGGVVAALLDEAMGWATVVHEERFTFTVELTVRYRAPVPVDCPISVTGWVKRDARRLLYCSGEIRNSEGTVLATGEAKFMRVDADESRSMAEALLYSPGSWRYPEPE